MDQTTDGVHAAHVFIDQLQDAIRRKSKHSVTCKAGCFHCCREPVYVERQEAVHMVEGCTPEECESIKARTVIWWAKFWSLGLDSISPEKSGKNRAELLLYRAGHLWCPFLVDGLCSQYARRPSGCRLHLAVGNPVNCEIEGRRLTQNFAEVKEMPEFILRSLSMQCEYAPQALFEFDHLGIWLAHLLLGETRRSEGGHNLVVKSV